MSKQVFWPLTLIIFGLIFLASNLGMLPREFYNIWPLILLIVGLGGLFTSDRLEWIPASKPAKSVSSVAHSKTKTKAPARRKK
jgi:hypothetical protein